MNATIELLTDDPKVSWWGWSNGTKIEKQEASVMMSMGIPTLNARNMAGPAVGASTGLVVMYLGWSMAILLGQYAFK